jgi:hypothetical protein
MVSTSVTVSDGDSIWARNQQGPDRAILIASQDRLHAYSSAYNAYSSRDIEDDPPAMASLLIRSCNGSTCTMESLWGTTSHGDDIQIAIEDDGRHVHIWGTLEGIEFEARMVATGPAYFRRGSTDDAELSHLSVSHMEWIGTGRDMRLTFARIGDRSVRFADVGDGYLNRGWSSRVCAMVSLNSC